jgi:two-component system sensor histidine kinase HydH
MPSPSARREALTKKLRSFFRVQDFAWFIFIGLLIAALPEPNYQASIILPLIGVFQIVEPRLPLFSTRTGRVVSITLKLILSYLLVGWSHSIDSYFSPIFLIPVVSAATTFGLGGVIVVTLIAILAYLSFLLPVFIIDYNQLPPGQISVVALRAAFFAIVAFVVYEQAKAKRDEMQRTEEAAARLAESNRHLREAQVSLRRSERLAALGQLTAGLAHELRNPLGTIKASAEMLKKNLAKGRPEVLAEMTDYIEAEVNRMNSLITSFLNFARPLQIQPAVADLHELIDDIVRHQFELAQSHSVRITTDLPPKPFKFKFDPSLLNIALSNLLQNAIQASPPGQQVEIRVMEQENTLTIRITDHGAGIQPEHLESIFNPFFTTKPQGVGLGLPLVSKIVDEHHGQIRVSSDAGQGATFEITLPTLEREVFA